METKLDHSEFIRSHGLDDYFESMPEKIRKSRVYYGKLIRTKAKHIDEEVVNEFKQEQDEHDETLGEKFTPILNFGKKHFIPTNLLLWDKVFCVIVTSKSHVISL